MGQSQPPRSSCVLVVEEDPILMLAMVEFVENAGGEAIEAMSVGEALQILETRPDIRTVFSDLDMRDAKAGMALALAIRDRWPPIELVLVSAQPWRMDELPERGVLVGKPFDRRKIEATLRHLTADRA